MKCPLCGYEFAEAEMKDGKCRACNFMNCEVRCCPHCGYQFVGESKVVNTIRRLFQWRGK